MMLAVTFQTLGNAKAKVSSSQVYLDYIGEFSIVTASVLPLNGIWHFQVGENFAYIFMQLKMCLKFISFVDGVHWIQLWAYLTLGHFRERLLLP